MNLKYDKNKSTSYCNYRKTNDKNLKVARKKIAYFKKTTVKLTPNFLVATMKTR